MHKLSNHITFHPASIIFKRQMFAYNKDVDEGISQRITQGLLHEMSLQVLAQGIVVWSNWLSFNL